MSSALSATSAAAAAVREAVFGIRLRSRSASRAGTKAENSSSLIDPPNRRFGTVRSYRFETRDRRASREYAIMAQGEAARSVIMYD
jgi:hypothetical protein